MLITESYRAMQSKLHENPNYGVASVQYAPLVAHAIGLEKAEEILDYGAGKGRLGTELRRRWVGRKLSVHHYEPAMPDWSGTPAPCDFVACIDVLEHIEPECLESVLDDLKRVTRKFGVFTVHTGPAVKVLPDGRNAHLIQRPPEWWMPKLEERFKIIATGSDAIGFWVFVHPKGANHGPTDRPGDSTR